MPTPPLAATRRMQVERAVRARGIAERGARLRLLPRQGQAQDARARDRGARRRRRARARCACASSATPGSCPPRTPTARSRGDTRPTGAFLLSPVRQPALGSLRGRAPVRLRAPPGDLQAGAHAHLRLLRAAAARRLGGRRPDRHQGRPQGRYAAGPGGALAEAAAAAGACARRSRGSPMCSDSRGARSRVEFETRAIHAGRSPTR